MDNLDIPAPKHPHSISSARHSRIEGFGRWIDGALFWLVIATSALVLAGFLSFCAWSLFQ